MNLAIAMSDSQFLTQVPLQTQVSTNTLDTDKEFLSQTQYNLATQEESVDWLPPSAQHAQPILSTIPQFEDGRPGSETVREVPNSSEESLECRPFILPATNSNVNPAQTQLQDETQSDVDLQQFPLVDWIKKIRSETPRRWPTFPLRWARTISKEQQAILDQDDAWSPPLAGRPVRPGTVPIRLLSLLTDKADKAALMARERDKTIQQDSESIPAKKRLNISTSLSKTADEEYDDQSEIATQHASQWSSSPPRARSRLAPPDTSPIRESTFNHHSAVNLGTERQSTYDVAGDNVSEQQGQSSFAPNARQPVEAHERFNSSPPEEFTQADDADRIIRQTEKLVPQHLTTLETNSADQSNDVDKMGKGRSKKTTPKVQVKETPFPKPVLRPRQPRTIEEDGLPQSSFVGATYPVLTPKSIRIEDDTIRGADQPEISVLTQSQRASPSQRQSDKPNQITAPSSSFNAQLGRLVDHQRQDNEIEQEQPPRKRVRLSPAKDKRTDPDYENIDQRRVLERRAFRQSIPADPRSKLLSHEPSLRNADNQRSISRTSSPQHTDKRSHAVISESGRTTATNFSMHRLTAYGPVVHKHAHVVTGFNPRAVELLVQRYRATYPAYRGDEKAFISAIRLIISLRSQPREPHPSLWDDFVFRKSDDYKTHLQYCIDEGENALPYQDFYHTNVRRPERLQEIISEDALVALYTEPPEPTQAGSTNSREKSITVRHDDSPEKEVIENTEAPPHEKSVPDPPEDNSEMHVDQSAGPLAEDRPTEIPTPKERKRSRRSLPWSVSQDTHAPLTSPRTAFTEVVASAPRSSASEKVEEWLNSSGDLIEEPDKSPDLPVPLPAPQVAQEATLPLRDDAQPLYAPENAKFAGKVVGGVSIKTPAKIRKTSTTVPESDMARFARLYASLQSERHASSSNEGHIPINVYTW